MSDRQKIKSESQEQFTERFDLALWATKTAKWDWDIARGVMWRSSGQQFIYGGDEIESSREFDIEGDDDPWILRLHPEDRAMVVQGLRAYLQTNASQTSESLNSVEYRYRRPNDEYIWIRSISRAIRAPDGKALRIVGSNSDITAQKLAENEARQLREAVDNASEGFALYDSDERFVYANKRYRELFPEITQHLVPGARREDIRQTYYSSGALPASVGRVDEFIHEVRQQQMAGKTSELQLETGTWIKRSDHILAHGGIVSIRTDITDVKQREEALQASEIRYRSLIEDQPEFVCRFKPDGSLLYSNAAYAQQGGFDPGAAAEVNIFDLVPPEERSSLRQHFAGLGPDKPIDKIEHRFFMADGSLCWMEWTNRAFLDDSGRVVELQVMGRDVTDRKIAEENFA